MKLYISAGIVVIALVYLPLVVWLLRRLWRRLPPRLPLRLAVIVPASIVAAAIPLWDVVLTSLDMARLCPTAGVFVKRSVQVDGYLVRWGGEDLLERGFKYIERVDSKGLITVHRREGDQIKTLKYAANDYQPVSRHEFIEAELSGQVVSGAHNIDMNRSVVRDRQTGEELGYAVLYRAHPGWVDRHTIALLGKVQATCPEKVTAQGIQLMEQVLLPK